MKKLNIIILSFLAVTLLLSCSSAKIYYSPDAKTIAKKHKMFAIAPPNVSIAPSKKIDAETMKEQQKTESINFQKEMYSWLLKRKMQNKISAEIQDVTTTNAKLRKAGYFDDAAAISPSEICDLLGVDAVLTSNYSLSKPMSEGAAVAIGLVAGFWGSTNKTAITLELHDKATQKLLWNYNDKLSGGVGSSPASLVDGMMRRASKKMPYKR